MNLYTEHLAGRDKRLAIYFARLSQYRAAAADFAEKLQSTGSADMTAVDAANTALREAEENAIADLMLPAADAAAILGYSRSQMTRICRDHGPDGTNQVRCQKRHGKLWYLYVPDVEYLIINDDIHGPRNQD